MMKIITEKVIDSKFRVEMVQEKIQEHIVTEKEALVRKIIIALLVLVVLLITEGFLLSKLLAIRSEVIDDQELTGEVPFKASTESLSLHPTSGSTTNSQTFSETSTESTSIGTAQSTTTTRTSINSESDVNADGTGSTTSNYPETSGTVSSLPASKPRQLELSSSRRTFLQTTPFEASTESPSSSSPEATHESPNTVHSTSGSTANSQTFSETSTESTSIGTAQSTTTTHTSINSESDVNTNGTGTKVGSTTSSTPATSANLTACSNITDCSDLALGFVCLNSTCSCDVYHEYHSASGTCQGMWSEWSDISRKKMTSHADLGDSYTKMATCTKMKLSRTRKCLAGDGSCAGLSTERNETEQTCFCHRCCEVNSCPIQAEGFTTCYCGKTSRSPKCIQSNCSLV